MPSRERFVVYALIAVLALANVMYLAGGHGRNATASAFAPDDLGPASRITLTDGEKELVLRAAGGRLAWGDGDRERAHTMGYVFIGKVLPQLMQRDEVKDERERLLEELRAEEEEYRDRLMEIQQRGESVDPDSPELQGIFQEWQAAEAAYREWQQAASERTGRLEATYLEEAYRELVEAVNIVADRLDIDIVHQFTPTDEPFDADNPRTAMSTIRWRSALRYPGELDITDAVVEELDLDIDWKPGE